LGVIVNRVHSDKDQGYYGYSSGYGYGYGYGYGHGYHYGDDTKETKAEDAAPQAAMQADVAVAEDELEPDPLSFVDRPEQDGVKRPGIVPRRVA